MNPIASVITRASRIPWVALVLLFPTLANAEWFRGSSRAIPLGESASPDAPVSSYAYGPRAMASLGLDSALYQAVDRGFRVGTSALLALENHESHSLLPDESLRSAFSLGAAWAYGESPRQVSSMAVPRERVFEFGLGIGQRVSRRIGNFALREPYRVDDVPFGAGGYFLSLDGATRLPWFGRYVVTTKLGLKLFTNAFPDLVGAHEISDHVADALREGARLETTAEIGVRIRTHLAWEPVLRLYLDAIDPHDDSAKPRWLGRLVTGVDIPGALRCLPYLDAQAGHGSGLAINRNELRLGLGVRLYAR